MLSHVDIQSKKAYQLRHLPGRGALKVAQETFRITVNDGTLNLSFLKGGAHTPAITAVEVFSTGSALAINSGGTAFTTGSGKTFSSAIYFAGRAVSSISSGRIANTTDDELYCSARYGTAFSFGLPSGNGAITLL